MLQKPLHQSYYIGSKNVFAGEYPGDKYGERAELKLQQMVLFGVRHFIDLTEEGELTPYAHLLPPECTHTRFPIRDVSVPQSVDEVYKLIMRIRELANRNDGYVYIHCWGGVGRTGVIVACYLAAEMEKPSFDEVMKNLRDRFSDMPKSEYRVTPETKEQEAFIARYIQEKTYLIKKETTKIIYHRHTGSGLAISMTVELYPDHMVCTYNDACKHHRQENECSYEMEHYEKLVKELSTILFSSRDKRPHPTGGAGYSYSFEVNGERYLSFNNHHRFSGDYYTVQELILQFIEEHGQQCITYHDCPDWARNYLLEFTTPVFHKGTVDEVETSGCNGEIENQQWTIFEDNGKYGLKDNDGMIVIPANYDEINSSGYLGRGWDLKIGDKWGYVDATGNVIVPVEYDDVALERYEMIRIKKGETWGLLDSQGQTVLPFEYEDIYVDAPNVYRVKKDGVYGIIDKNGKILLPFKYKNLGAFDRNGFAYAENEERLYGYIDREDHIIIPFKYKQVKMFDGHYAIVSKDYGETGVVDREGNVVVPLKYYYIYIRRHDIIEVEKTVEGERLRGLYDLRNGFMLPCMYRKIECMGRDDEGILECKCRKGFYSTPVVVKVDSKKILKETIDLKTASKEERVEYLWDCFEFDEELVGSVREYPERVSVLDRTCSCGGNVIKMYYRSSPESWRNLAGRAGWLIICTKCMHQYDFLCTIMN